MRTAVIGSGPAGVAAAHALASGGSEVTIIDVGAKAEPDILKPFQALARQAPERWPSDARERIRGSFPVGIRSVGVKPAFGSLFPYAIDDRDLSVSGENTATLPSLARGGLSNAWGAAVLPFRQRDIGDWPISVSELAPHYEAVLRFVPLAGERDALETMYPLYAEPRPLRRSPQVARILDRLARSSTALEREGIRWGRSRLAVRGGESTEPHRCRYSGMCLYGCPYGSIYSAGDTLTELIAHPAVVYRPGLYVDRVTEADGEVRIEAHERDGGRRVELTADRAFVAAGAISSTRLMIDSLEIRRPVRLVDSGFFMFPLLTGAGSAVSSARQGNTLAQVFLELEDETVSRHTVHLQLYGYNDLMIGAVAGMLPLPATMLEQGLQPLLGRLLAIQGYFHSAESAGIVLHRTRDGVRLVGDRAPSAVNRLVRRLAASARRLGMAPIPHLLQAGAPGKGNHVGGSFPMRREPGPLQSDLLGRPHGLARVHLVDASVMPSIPASTITLSIMANAHRIATEVTIRERSGDTAD